VRLRKEFSGKYLNLREGKGKEGKKQNCKKEIHNS
jgi:hypothetical protein